MSLRPVLFILLLQIACGDADSQLKVTTLRLGRDNGLAYLFPLVRAGNKQAEQKINVFLQRQLLENETVLTDTNKVFEKTRYIETDSVHQSGYTSINYAVGVNNSKVLSVAFETLIMGAYEYEFVAYYNFSVGSGTVITAKDLFGPKGIVAVKEILISKRKKLISEWLKEADTLYGKDDLVLMEERFGECNAEADENDFLIKAGSIFFHKRPCFSHAGMHRETDLNIEFNFADINKYLSDNGKRLLLQKR
jgi:hypothetical protein